MKNKIILIAAVVFGLLAAVLTRAYLSAKNDEFRALRERFARTHGTMDVLCFRKDVPGGAVLTRDELGLKTVPKTGLRGQALTEDSLADVLGRKLVGGRKTGELLFWADIEGGNPTAGGLAADIRRKMRALSISVSGASAVSGMVRPNDHVDVVGTFSFPKTAPDGKTVFQELVTCTILQNVLVLATGQETAKTRLRGGFPPTAGGAYSTVTLEVSPREAEMLVFAEQIKGRLSLTLRNRNDTSYETELPQVDFAKIRSEIEELNVKRQTEIGGRR